MPEVDAGPDTQSDRESFLESLMDGDLYSMGAYFCDRHPELVDEVVGMLQAFGDVEVTERVHTKEDVTFTLPKGVAQ